MSRLFLFFILALLSLPLAGCRKPVAAAPEPPPQKVKFVTPNEEVVGEFEEFPGRTAALEIVELRSRVTGYLDKIAFEDGIQVSKGDLLFVIDPRTYRAEEARTKAMIEQQTARLSRLERQQKRSQELFEKQAVSQDEYETIMFDSNEAKAALDAAIAAHDLAKLNVEFTKINAPIHGRISRRLVDVGNLVMANETPLATLIPLDEVYVYFDMDERTVLRLRRLALQQSSKGNAAQPSDVKVEIGLSDSDQFDLSGVIDFEENQVDASTGTLRVRAIVKNKDGLLSPGLFVRVRYPVGKPESQLLIPEESLGSDQGQPFVYVIGDGNKVAYRSVEIGQQVGAQRVIRDGLKKGERVVVTGLQRVRRNAQVIPEPLQTKLPPAKVAEKGKSTAVSGQTPRTKGTSSGDAE
jgi:RND family efflux transporter MFP subunit